MKVQSIYRSRVVVADGDEPLASAATRMREQQVGSAVAAMLEVECRHLPVVADGRVVGMVSIRDLLGTAIRVA